MPLRASTCRKSRSHRRAGGEDRGRGQGRHTRPRAGRENRGRGRGRHTRTAGSPPPNLVPDRSSGDADTRRRPGCRQTAASPERRRAWTPNSPGECHEPTRGRHRTIGQQQAAPLGAHARADGARLDHRRPRCDGDRPRARPRLASRPRARGAGELHGRVLDPQRDRHLPVGPGGAGPTPPTTARSRCDRDRDGRGRARGERWNDVPARHPGCRDRADGDRASARWLRARRRVGPALASRSAIGDPRDRAMSTPVS